MATIERLSTASRESRDRKPASGTHGWASVERVSSTTFLLFVVLACLWIVWRAPVFPTLDGPVHMYNAEIIRDLLFHNGRIYGSYYTLRALPPTYLFHPALLVLLNSVFDPEITNKLVVSLYILVFAFGIRYLFNSLGPSSWQPLLCVPFILNRMVYMGFVNSNFALASAFWVIGYWIRTAGKLSIRRATLVVAGVVLVGTMHAIGVALLVLFLGIETATLLVWKEPEQPPSKRLLATRIYRYRGEIGVTAVSALVPVAIFLIGKLSTSHNPNATPVPPAGIMLKSRVIEFVTSWHLAPMQDHRYRFFLALLLLLLLIVFVKHLLRKQVDWSPGRVAVLVTATVSLLIFALTPSDLMQANYLSARFAFFALILLFTVVAGIRSTWREGVICMLVIAGVSAYVTYRLAVETQNEAVVAASVSRLPALDPGARVFVVWGSSPENLYARARSVDLIRRSNAFLANHTWLTFWYTMPAPKFPHPCTDLKPRDYPNCLSSKLDPNEVDAVIWTDPLPSDRPMEKLVASSLGLSGIENAAPGLDIYTRRIASARGADH